jgi:hypothetical protein
MKAYGGVVVYIHVSLTSALVGGEQSASIPGRFTLGERASGTNWIGGWVGLRAGENSCPHRNSNSNLLVVQLVTIRYTDYAIPDLNKNLYLKKTMSISSITVYSLIRTL